MVSQGTGTHAATGATIEWGKTGTTENNGDAWFVGATEDITVAVWVGHANSVKPMETEYGGAPVDGGTIPALIFHDVVLAYERAGPRRGGRRGIDRPTPEATATTPPLPASARTRAPDRAGTRPSAQGNNRAAAAHPAAPPPTGGGVSGGTGGASRRASR